MLGFKAGVVLLTVRSSSTKRVVERGVSDDHKKGELQISVGGHLNENSRGSMGSANAGV